MQAIILAAGEGKRMRPLTEHMPKPMIQVAGKNFIEHNVAALPDEITELVIIVGYKSDQIINYFGTRYAGRTITYVEQKEPLGTGHAVWLCRPHITGRFLILNGDNIYSKADIEACLAHERAWMVQKVVGGFTGGKIVADNAGNVVAVEEGVHKNEAYLNLNSFVLTPEFFDYNYTLGSFGDKGEYGLPQIVVHMAKKYPIKLVEAHNWKQVTTVQDVEDLARELSSKGH